MLTKRALNMVRCRLGFLLGRMGIYRFRHMPEFLSVEPANWCMLRCPECKVGQEYQGKTRQLLSTELMQKILDECGQYLHTIQFFFQGEPLLNKQLPSLIRMAKQYHIYTVVSTNALLLTKEYAEQLMESGLDRIIVSIDGFSEQSYSQYRVGGSLGKALEGLRLLAEAKRHLKAHCIIEWQCLRLKSNQEEWETIRRNYRRLGADRLTFKTAQFNDFANGNPLMPDNERFSRYKQTADGTFVRKKPYKNRCFRLWSGAVITTSGDLLPCCFDKSAQHSFGNLADGSIRALWHSAAAEQFRKRILQNRSSVPICLNCSE